MLFCAGLCTLLRWNCTVPRAPGFRADLPLPTNDADHDYDWNVLGCLMYIGSYPVASTRVYRYDWKRLSEWSPFEELQRGRSHAQAPSHVTLLLPFAILVSYFLGAVVHHQQLYL